MELRTLGQQAPDHGCTDTTSVGQTATATHRLQTSVVKILGRGEWDSDVFLTPPFAQPMSQRICWLRSAAPGKSRPVANNSG